MDVPVWCRDRRFADIVGTAVEAEVIGHGYIFTEGPVWHPRERTLVFSDIPANRLHVWRPGLPVRVLRKPRQMANGNTQGFQRQHRVDAGLRPHQQRRPRQYAIRIDLEGQRADAGRGLFQDA